MEGINRRDFLRAGAVASTAAAAACTYDYKVPAEKVLPYVANPENVQPGLASYYAGLCNGCATACGLVARNNDGRVVHVEGNPDHPSGPGLCARGHFDFVAAYGPDRVDGPMLGNDKLSWDDATAKLLEAWNGAVAAGKGVAWLGQYRTGSVAALLGALAGAGLRRVHFEPVGVESLLAASRRAFGLDELPVYELAEARTIVSFGMDFLGTAFGSMAMTKGWARAKDPAQGKFVARTVAITPRVGQSESQADHWIAARPGSEAKVALAIAKLAGEAKGYQGPAAALLGGIDVAAAASASDVSEDKLREVAGWLAGAEPSVVLPGGNANAGADATALAVATLLCNEVLGNVGRTVVFRGSRPGQVNSYADAKALLDDCKAGKIGLLLVDGLDPAHGLPADADAAGALAAVDRVVQFANSGNDSTNDKTLILPSGSGLEQWTDASTEPGLHVLGQPAMVPLKDSRGMGEVLLGLAKAVAPAAPTGAAADPATVVAVPIHASAANFAEYIRMRWAAEVWPTVPGMPEAGAWWREVQAKGVVHVPGGNVAAAWVAAELPAAGEAPSGGGKHTLVVYPSPLLHDGRWANVPWAQELPDPISTFFWGTWAEIHPDTAAEMGLGEKDLVEVSTGLGSIKVGWFGSKGVRKDVVAIIAGNGKKTGRYAKGRGANAVSLLAGATDSASGAMAWLSTQANLRRAGGDSGVHPLCGNLDQAGRHLANNVSVKDALDKLEGEAASIVPVHHVPIDERVVENGPVDMFPEPQHPTYRFALNFDLNACNGCGACVVACALENNTPFIGPDQMRRGRTMTWIRMDRFWEGEGENQDVRYLPAVCQQCSHAPCEGVCPVLATYHNLDGLNAMIYNRCVGTRYCANNCPYAARRFNYHTWEWPESYHLMLNPDLTAREMGVMEKCTFCVHRLHHAKDSWRDIKEAVPDSALQKITACAAACPSSAIVFGNWKDADGAVRKKGESPRSYTLLGELNTKPGVRYAARVSYHQPIFGGHGAGHGGGHGGGDHGEAPAEHGADHGSPGKEAGHGAAEGGH
ncbi:MAG: 4Fe-4S dicluster domain-containing protein [Deltaproteobacteria bacterium]|nr:4Fe-4S dicluster domain-containing protein [Deltaproteobacteria bacterium]